MGRRPCREHSEHVPHDDARGCQAGRAAGDLAGVIDALSISRRSRRRGADQIDGAGNRHRAAPRERSNRSFEQVVLQRRVSGPKRRAHRGRVPEDAPGAVRRVRAAPEASILRRTARRGRRRVHAGPADGDACPPAPDPSVPRSVTRLCFPASCVSRSSKAASS